MNRGAPPPRQRREGGALTIAPTTQHTEQEGKTHTVMPTRQRLPATRMLCAKHGNKRAQTGDFSSPLPHFAHDDRSETSTFTRSALRARTYARLSWFSFFAFTSSLALRKSLSISALRVKTLSFSSSHRSSPSDRIINNSKQSLFQQNKTRQLPFPLRYIGGEGKIPKPSHLTSYCTKIYRHPVKE